MVRRPAAAIFDLDRTLVPSASGRVFQRHLAEAELGPTTGGIVGEALFRIFELVGESRTIMRLARLAPRAMKGVAADRLLEAAERAADDLADAVLPYAKMLIAEHREAGRRLAMATTTPRHLVAPLAERLGIDTVLATEWEQADGVFTGRLDGELVWGRGKLNRVKAWAKAEGIDLRASFAYSDSYFDAPLLAAVGHPVAVNPDPRLTAVAVLRGWPIRHLDVPDGVVKIAGRELQDLVRPFANEALIPNAKIEIRGLENIPATGSAIVCANHRSYLDGVIMSIAIAKAGRAARFLGKKEVFDVPVFGVLAKAAGGIRVDRGTGSDEPLVEAVKALRAGEVVMLMPQGTIPRGPAFFEPELKARWGAARLAALSGAPVIPAGLWGTEDVWPRSARLPRMDVAHPPPVSVNIGLPVELTHTDPTDDSRRIMSAISALLPPAARERRTPTPEELARTYPRGYKGDPTAEAERRPGTDT